MKKYLIVFMFLLLPKVSEAAVISQVIDFQGIITQADNWTNVNVGDPFTGVFNYVFDENQVSKSSAPGTNTYALSDSSISFNILDAVVFSATNLDLTISDGFVDSLFFIDNGPSFSTGAASSLFFDELLIGLNGVQLESNGLSRIQQLGVGGWSTIIFDQNSLQEFTLAGDFSPSTKPIPEPGMISLVGLGLVGLFRRKQWKN